MLKTLIEPKLEKPKDIKFDNKQLMNLVYPIIGEQFLVLLVGICDTLMVSYAGESAVSGVSLVNQLNTVFILVFTALASGGAVIASQYVGKQDKKGGIRASSQLMMISTVISLLLTVLILIFGTTIFKILFGQVEQSVFKDGMDYLYISAYSFVSLAIYNGAAAIYRAMGKTKTIMNISFVMNAINVIGNTIGIFVLHAGVAGVAYPSLISRVFGAIVMFILLLDKKNVLYVTFHDIFMIDFQMIKRLFYVAIPNTIENGLFQLSKVALSSIVAMFGTVQIAANGIAQSFWSMAALFSIAMGNAFITVIGQYMGANDIKGAQYYLMKLLRISYIGSISWNLGFLILTPFLLKLYSLSNETVYYVIVLVIIHNVFNAMICPVSFAFSNGLRAAGDVKYTMYSSLFATVFIRVLFSIILAIVFHMGVIGIAFAMVIDWFVKGLLMIQRYHSGKWQEFKLIS